MPSITLTNPVAGTEAQAGIIATNFSLLQTLLNGGLDGVNIDATADLDAVARVGVRKNTAGSTFERRRLNLIEGSGVTLTVADDSANEEVDITIAAGSTTGLEQEVDYVAKTGTTAGTATTEGGADTIITGTSQAYTNVKHYIKVNLPSCMSSGGADVVFVLLRGATVVGQQRLVTTGNVTAKYLEWVDTPPASTFSYVVKAFSASAQTHTLGGGAGGSGVVAAGWLKVAKLT